MRRYVEELWLPYNRELERTVAEFALADRPDADLVDAEAEFRSGRLAEDGFEIWIAVDDAAADGVDADAELGAADLPLAGFVAAEREPAPTVFDRPDRLVIDDLYVRELYRGGDLARDLVGRAASYAEAADCPQVALDVDTDNERARAFYDSLGFEPRRHRLVVDTAEL